MRLLHKLMLATLLLRRGAAFAPAVLGRPGCRTCASRVQMAGSSGSCLSPPALRRRDLLAAGAAAVGSVTWLCRSSQAVAGQLPAILCDDAVSHLTAPDGQSIYIIGTAHISTKSADLVNEVISYVKPDVVMIELDRSRLPMLQREGNTTTSTSSTPNSTSGSRAEPLTSSAGSMASAPAEQPPAQQQQQQQSGAPGAPGALNKLMAKLLPGGGSAGAGGGGGGPSFVTAITAAGAGKIISGLYQYLNGIGFQSGGEFVAAIEAARGVGAKILLGDRPVNVTLNHLAEAIRATGVRRLLTVELLPEDVDPALLEKVDGATTKESITSMMELMKKRDTVDKLMAVVQRELPLVYTAMVAERDAYMADAVTEYLSLTGRGSACMVVGMAHMSGIERNLRAKHGFGGGGAGPSSAACGPAPAAVAAPWQRVPQAA